MSIATKLEYRGVVFGRNDQSLSYKLRPFCALSNSRRVPAANRKGPAISRSDRYLPRHCFSLIWFRTLRLVSFWNTPLERHFLCRPRAKLMAACERATAPPCDTVISAQL